MCGLDLYLSLIRSYITITMAAVVVVIVVVVSGAETNRPALITETMLVQSIELWRISLLVLPGEFVGRWLFTVSPLCKSHTDCMHS